MASLDASESETPLQQAVRLAGSQSELARRIGFTQGSVWRWLNGTELPGEAVLPIEQATGVSRHDLRPDLYPRDSAELDERTPPDSRDAALDRRPHAGGLAGLEPAR